MPVPPRRVAPNLFHLGVSYQSNLLTVVVAVPARNEEARIAACLAALDTAARRAADRCCVVAIAVLANNCTDSTADVVRACSLQTSAPIVLKTVELRPAIAHAGTARRMAAEFAAEQVCNAARADAFLLTTDADTRVQPDWILRTLDAFEAGADAVAGLFTYDDRDLARWPAALQRRTRLEGTYSLLATELDHRIDPSLHDPWPRHDLASGASLAVRLDVLAACGGFPAVRVGEDRALVEALKASGARVRHDPAVRVATSGRLVGRAPGGAADTILHRLIDPQTSCDDRLERVSATVLRATWRRRLRNLHGAGRLGVDTGWAPALGLERATVRTRGTFGRFWQDVEVQSPRLVRAPLLPDQLAQEIELARHALARLLGGDAALTCGAEHPADSPTCASAGAA